MKAGAVWVLELVTLCVDGVVWGVAACTAYRWLAGNGARWLGPALAVGLVFVVWDHWVFGELVHWAGFPRGHGEPFGLLEVAIQLAATLVGFRAGDFLVASIARRARASGLSGADASRVGDPPRPG